MMQDWSYCFSMEAGKTYRIRYVYLGASDVREATFTYKGDMMYGMDNVPYIYPDESDGRVITGMVQILSIDELVAKADVV